MSWEKFIDAMPPAVVMLSEMTPPSIEYAVWLPPPRTETVNRVLNCAVEPRPTVTPGSSEASCMKLRPFSGRSIMVARSMEPCTELLS